ncbi:hypothetical protein VTK26DRAFT_6638 [Humicola hyalothermophila]
MCLSLSLMFFSRFRFEIPGVWKHLYARPCLHLFGFFFFFSFFSFFFFFCIYPIPILLFLFSFQQGGRRKLGIIRVWLGAAGAKERHLQIHQMYFGISLLCPVLFAFSPSRIFLRDSLSVRVCVDLFPFLSGRTRDRLCFFSTPDVPWLREEGLQVREGTIYVWVGWK